MLMKRHFTGLTDAGIVRAVNQDDYYVDPEGRFFILADGMGGHAGGQEASQIATRIIRQYLEQEWNAYEEPQGLLKYAINQANEAILADQIEHPERQDMGTTIVVVIFWHQEVWRAHVGDSRLYCLRSGVLAQITEDHTWVSRAIKSGDISAEQAKVHPWRHVLSQCLGRKELYRFDIDPLDVQQGDRLLLCSDGLSEEVTDDQIQSILVDSETLEKAALCLVEAAKENGGSDNITVVLVDELGDPTS